MVSSFVLNDVGISTLEGRSRRRHTPLMPINTRKYVQIPKLLVRLVPLASTQLFLLSHHPEFLSGPSLQLQGSFIPFSKIGLHVSNKMGRACGAYG